MHQRCGTGGVASEAVVGETAAWALPDGDLKIITKLKRLFC